MPDETASTIVSEVKTTSDGDVKITVEKYNELLDKIAQQSGKIGTLNESLRQARNQPPVINRTVINKTDEMLMQEYRVWGATFMGLGSCLFVVGAVLFRAGKP